MATSGLPLSKWVSSAELDQILNCLAKPGVEAVEPISLLPSAGCEVVDYRNAAFVKVPARNMSRSCRTANTTRILAGVTLFDAESATMESIASRDPPGFKVRWTQLNNANEFARVVESSGKRSSRVSRSDNLMFLPIPSAQPLNATTNVAAAVTIVTEPIK